MVESANALQEFVYAVSHDFGRPVRQVVAFSNLLSDKHDAELDEESKEWLSYLQRAGLEAQLMLDRLLAYSRLATHEPQVAEQALRPLCEEVVVAALAKHPSCADRLTVSGDATLPVDRELFKQMLAELVDNALRYGEGDAAISLEAREDAVVITVQDGGCGFPEEQEPAALRPFGRLQAEDPEHVGLGLSICARALERLHGRMTFVRGERGFTVEACLERPT